MDDEKGRDVGKRDATEIRAHAPFPSYVTYFLYSVPLCQEEALIFRFRQALSRRAYFLICSRTRAMSSSMNLTLSGSSAYPALAFSR